jgi:hypothetical protein
MGNSRTDLVAVQRCAQIKIAQITKTLVNPLEPSAAMLIGSLVHPAVHWKTARRALPSAKLRRLLREMQLKLIQRRAFNAHIKEDLVSKLGI